MRTSVGLFLLHGRCFPPRTDKPCRDISSPFPATTLTIPSFRRNGGITPAIFATKPESDSALSSPSSVMPSSRSFQRTPTSGMFAMSGWPTLR